MARYSNPQAGPGSVRSTHHPRTPLEAYTVHVPGDMEVGYKRLPVRAGTPGTPGTPTGHGEPWRAMSWLC